MQVVGVIRYPLLSNVMFDNSVTQLVRAEDLATETDVLLHPDEPATRAFELFQAETDDCIPVVTREEPNELLGVVRRSDVVHALITQRRRAVAVSKRMYDFLTAPRPMVTAQQPVQRPRLRYVRVT